MECSLDSRTIPPVFPGEPLALYFSTEFEVYVYPNFGKECIKCVLSVSRVLQLP